MHRISACTRWPGLFGRELFAPTWQPDSGTYHSTVVLYSMYSVYRRCMYTHMPSFVFLCFSPHSLYTKGAFFSTYTPYIKTYKTAVEYVPLIMGLPPRPAISPRASGCRKHSQAKHLGERVVLYWLRQGISTCGREVHQQGFCKSQCEYIRI